MLKRFVSYLGRGKSLEEPAPAPSGDDDAASRLHAAAEALRAGRLEEAEELLEGLLKKHHDCAEAHLLLGDANKARGLKDDARDSYILAQCFKPTWSVPFERLGMLAFDEGQCDEAIAALRQALSRGANNGTVHNTLGAAYYEKDRLDEAFHHLKAALALQPDFPEAHSNIGLLLFRGLEQFDEGASHLETALRLKPDHAGALCNWIMVLQHRGRIEEALSLCNELLTRDPTLHEARLIRGLILLGKREFSPGWADYELRKAVRSNYQLRSLPWPEWSGSSLKGKTIYVHLEQGLGDEIMFASCLPDIIAEANKCICECSPKLHRLFRHSFPGAVIVGKEAWREPGFSALHAPDHQTAIGSLPRFLRNSPQDFPMHQGYLTADPDRVTYWRTRLAALPGRTKIGISWRGGAKSTRGTLRSIPLHQWLPILTLPDCDFVSLQYSECEEELADVRRLGLRVEHWQEAIDDYSETAALVTALDLVVSVQTAVVHLAGALGKPVWALISAAAEWRYGCSGETMPWYPSARLTRQTTIGEWDSVIARLQSALSVWTSAR